MWELDCNDSWVLKNWCLPTMVLEKTLESPLDCKEIQAVHPKGNQPWIFTGRTDAEAPILWPPDVKSWHIGKDPDAWKDWGQKGTTEDEMVGWHHWPNGHEFEQALGDGKGQEAWRAAVHGVAKSWTWLSNWTTTAKAIWRNQAPLLRQHYKATVIKTVTTGTKINIWSMKQESKPRDNPSTYGQLIYDGGGKNI